MSEAEDRAVASYFGLPRDAQWLDEGSNDPWHINGLPLRVTTIGAVFDESLPQHCREDSKVSASLDEMHNHLRSAEECLYRALNQSSAVVRADLRDNEWEDR